MAVTMKQFHRDVAAKRGRGGGDDWTRPPGPKQALRNQYFPSLSAARMCCNLLKTKMLFPTRYPSEIVDSEKWRAQRHDKKEKHLQTNKRTRRRFRSSTFLQLFLDSNRHNELLASCDKKAKLKDEAESKTGRDHRAQKILDEPEPPTHIHLLLILSP